MYNSLDIILEQHGIILNEGIKDRITDFYKNMQSASKNKIKTYVKNKNKEQKKLFSRMKKIMTQNDISVEKIEALVDEKSNEYKNTIVQAVKNEDEQKVKNGFKNSIKEFFTALKELISPEKLSDESTFKAILIFCVLYFLLSLLYVICTLLFGPFLAQLLTIVVFAPIFEEYAKSVAIRKNNAGKFLIVFNIVEFTTYMLTIVYMGSTGIFGIGSVIVASLMRVVVIFFHYTTAATQKMYAKKDKKQIGLILAIILHGLWNGGNVLHSILKQI